MEFENYIFDLYGTLIDIHTDEEQPVLWEKMAEYLEEHFEVSYEAKELRAEYLRICAQEEELLKKRTGAEYPEIRITWVWKRLVEKSDISGQEAFLPDMDAAEEVSEEMEKLCIYFREVSRDKLVKYRGVDETLDKLKKNGKKIYLLSNAQRPFTMDELRQTGLLRYFDDIFISSDKLLKKPDKKFMEMLLHKNSLDWTKCVMIGNDLESDVGVAVKNGVRSIFLNTYSDSEEKIDRILNSIDEALWPVIIKDGDVSKIF